MVKCAKKLLKLPINAEKVKNITEKSVEFSIDLEYNKLSNLNHKKGG
jgi:hypothetical protein